MIKKFLLVDDDEDDRETFSSTLKSIEPEIVCYCSSNANDALDKLEKGIYQDPDIIFLDINMPVINGWECLTALRSNKRYRRTPIIMYSTSSSPMEINTALQSGALCFLTKPDEYRTLRNILAVISENLDKDLLSAVRGFDEIKFNRSSAI